jgi:hypothetical protein
VIQGSDATSIAKWHEALRRQFLNEVVIGFAAIARSRGVEEDDLIHLLVIEYPQDIQRIANVFGGIKPYGFV